MRQLLPLLILVTIFASTSAFAQDEKKSGDAKPEEKPKTETQLFNQIRTDFTARKYREAESALKEFEARFPNSPRLQSLQYSGYIAYARVRNYPRATPLIAAAVDTGLKQLEKNPRTASTLVSYTNSLVSMLRRVGKNDEASEKLNTVLAAIDKVNDGSNPSLSSGYSNLVYTKAMLISGDKPDDAFDLVSAEVDKAREAFEKDSNNAANLQWYASTQFLQLRVASSASPEQFGKLRDAHLKFVTAQAEEKQDNAAAISAYSSAHSYGIATLVSEDVDRAEKLLASATEFLDGIESKNQLIRNIVASGKRSLSSNTRRIETAKKHRALIGTDAVPLDAEAWINGNPLTDADLKGKVVLLDFWAVWCGPCIATFPHLIEWNERYADKGLVIIGATRHYKYDWDATANRIKREPQLAPEDENKAIEQFAAFHKLQHRLMVTPPGSSFQTAYAVSGIPQAVLIGRDGKIRMIKVGSGPTNAKALHDEIEKLLAE